MNNEIECQEIRLAAMAVAEGESPSRNSVQISEHLESCEPCRNSVRQDGQPLFPETARRAPHAADFWPAIDSRLSREQAELATNRSARAVPWRSPWVLGLSALACLLLVMAGAIWITLGWNGASLVGTPRPLEASTKPSPFEIPWGPPEHVDPAEFLERFSFFFGPEFQKGQAERIGSDDDADSLRSVTIRKLEGPLGTLFIDRAGVVMLAVPYPLVSEFHEGLAAVGTAVDWKSGGHLTNFGFIDRTGKLVIAPEYDYADRFSDGLAAVHKKNKWGYINRRGEVVVPLRYRSAEAFRDGIACAWQEGDTVEFLDKSGKVLKTFNRHDVGRFSEGLLYVNLPGKQGFDSGRARGYVDRNFEFVFRLGEDSSGFFPARCEEFHDGMAAVEVGGSNQWSFITREGKLTIPGPYAQVLPFSEGLAAVTRERGVYAKRGYIDREGNEVIAPRFLQAGSFSEGLASVLIPLEDEADGDLPAGDAAGPVKGKLGYIDRAGNVIIEPRFYTVGPFENGLAQVSENPFHTGFIDKTGAYVWQFTEPKFGP